MAALPANNKLRLFIKIFTGCDIGLVDCEVGMYYCISQDDIQFNSLTNSIVIVIVWFADALVEVLTSGKCTE